MRELLGLGVGLGRHLVIEMYECRPELLDDVDYLREVLIEAAKATRSTILWSRFHKFSPQGVTGIVTVAESHLSIHTWPEYGYAAVDVFTCGSHTDPWRALEVIREALRPGRVSVLEIRRGILVGPLLEEVQAQRA